MMCISYLEDFRMYDLAYAALATSMYVLTYVSVYLSGRIMHMYCSTYEAQVAFTSKTKGYQNENGWICRIPTASKQLFTYVCIKF